MNPTMSDNFAAILAMDAAESDLGSSKETNRFPRTLSTSVLRIKHHSSFWERFWENHRRLA